MRLIINVAALAAMAAVPSIAQALELAVKLEMHGNFEVKATITNPTDEDVKVLKTGSILDSAPVQKAQVSYEGGNVPFRGIRYQLGSQSEESEFQVIAAGGHVETIFNIADTYNLSNSATYGVQSKGYIHYAQGGDITKLDAIAYESNSLRTFIDGAVASNSSLNRMEKRAAVQACYGGQLEAVQIAHQNILSMAQTAAHEARNGPAWRMEKFFGRYDYEARFFVASVYDNIFRAYSTYSKPEVYCQDFYGHCRARTSAYCMIGADFIVYCPNFFQFPSTMPACGSVDQAHVAIHEATHLSFTQQTDDYNLYGYLSGNRLSSEYRFNHADTYAYFAHDSWVGC